MLLVRRVAQRAGSARARGVPAACARGLAGRGTSADKSAVRASSRRRERARPRPPAHPQRARAPSAQARGEQTREERTLAEEGEVYDQMISRLGGDTERQFRLPPPEPDLGALETWAPAALVSADPDENILRFRTRFYLDSEHSAFSGTQPDAAKKVVLLVSVDKLGLTDMERARLVSVAHQRYDSRTGDLRLTCNRYASSVKAKAELRGARHPSPCPVPFPGPTRASTRHPPISTWQICSVGSSPTRARTQRRTPTRSKAHCRSARARGRGLEGARTSDQSTGPSGSSERVGPAQQQ